VRGWSVGRLRRRLSARLGDHNQPRSLNAVKLKDVLGKIEPNSRDSIQIGDRLSDRRRSLQTVALTTTAWSQRLRRRLCGAGAGGVPAAHDGRPEDRRSSARGRRPGGWATGRRAGLMGRACGWSAIQPEGPAEMAPVKPRIVITYCTQCQWLLRAGWLAQELLSTFGGRPGRGCAGPGNRWRLRHCL
jgi:Rdx family